MEDHERLRVLLIEDDPDDRLIMEALLEKIEPWVADLTWAPTYEEGVARVEEGDFDVVLCDYRLGARTGLELVSEPSVRQRAVPVIILTGQSGREIDLQAAEAGAVDYLQKGNLTPEILERSIRYTVEFRRRHGVEARFQALMENSNDLTTILEADGIIIYVSPSLGRVLGFDPTAAVGTNVLEAVHPAERPAMEAAFRDLIESPHRSTRVQCRMAHADGEWRVMDIIGQNLLDVPFIGGIVTNAWDITVLRRAEEKLQSQKVDLQERVKELRCLFAVDRALRDAELPWDRALQEVVDALPPGFQRPELVGARLALVDHIATTAGFRDTDWSLLAPVMAGEERIGVVEIGLTSPEPGETGRTFLSEEADLLRAVADRVGEARRRRWAEQSLRREEAYFRTLAERSGVVMVVLDRELTVRYVSTERGGILERPRWALIGAPALSFVRPSDHERAQRIARAALESPDRTVEDQLTVVRPDGEDRVVRMTVRNLLDDPAVEGLVLTLRDITERVQQEERTRFQAELLERVGQAVLAVDGDDQVVYWNRAAEELTGWSWEEVRGQVVLDRIITEESREAGLAARHPSRAGEPWSGELTLRRKDGREVIVQVSITPTGAQAGGRSGRIVVAADITELRQAERTLRHQKALVDTVVSSAPMILFALDPEGRVTLSEGKGLPTLGLEPGETVGRSALEMYADHPRLLEDLRRALAGDSFRVEQRVDEHVFETWWSPLDDGQGTLGVSLDVTDTAKASERIAFQAELLDAVGQAVIATDLEGRVTYWNRAAEDLYGWAREETLGESILELTVAEDSLEEAVETMAALEKGESWTGDFMVRRKDGSRFMALVTNAPIEDRSGRLTGIIGVSSDISDRRELEEQLRQAQKMEAIGRLAGGVAHDFNNILTVIRGHSQMLLEDLPDDSPHRSDIGQVLREADRAATLTRQLLAFSRRQVLQERVLDMHGVLDDMAPMLRRLIPARIELRFETVGEAHLVRADPSQIHQVILNLAVNAGDAIPDAGTITFRVGMRELSLREARDLPWDTKPGRYVELRVEDTGRGIPDDVIEHIFEPFFTTKPEGQGTGLGLSMTFGIVKQSGGHVLVESEAGRGTTFCVLLPEVEEGVRATEETKAPRAPGRLGRGTILLVEDDSAVRHVSVRLLERAGYSVLEASNGREALELVERNRDRVDLVISDIVMPEVGGLQLLEELRTLRPDLEIVLTSGYSEEELPVEIRRRASSFLEKPFSPDELIALVQATLG